MSTTAKVKLQKQIAEIERAIVLHPIETQLPSGVEVNPGVSVISF